MIAHAVWLYFPFPLSLRLVEEMLLERSIVVSYELMKKQVVPADILSNRKFLLLTDLSIIDR